MRAGGSTIILKEVFGAIFANNHILLIIVIFGVEGLSVAISRVLRREILNCSLQTALGRHSLRILIFGSIGLILKIGHRVVLV